MEVVSVPVRLMVVPGEAQTLALLEVSKMAGLGCTVTVEVLPVPVQPFASVTVTL